MRDCSLLGRKGDSRATLSVLNSERVLLQGQDLTPRSNGKCNTQANETRVTNIHNYVGSSKGQTPALHSGGAGSPAGCRWV